MIAPRAESANLDITNDVSVSLDTLASQVVSQLGGGREGEGGQRETRQEPHSPIPAASGSSLVRGESTKRKSKGKTKKSHGKKKKGQEKPVEESEEEMESDEEPHTNSNDFPKDARPELFQDDRKFNRLSYETAAKICWEHRQLKERKALNVLVEKLLIFFF